MAREPSCGAYASVTYGTPTVIRPGMQSPWRTRSPSSTGKLGANATATVGTTIAPEASTSDARRPMRSDSGPQNHAPTASAPITTEIVRPACDGVTPKVPPELGQDRLRRVHHREHGGRRDQERRHARAGHDAAGTSVARRPAETTVPQPAATAATTTAVCQPAESAITPAAAAPSAIPATSAVSGHV